MIKKVVIVLFAAHTQNSEPCGELLLELTKSGRPLFVLPSIDVDLTAGELPTQTVARFAASLGLSMPSAAWSLLGVVRDESAVAFTASVSPAVMRGLADTKRFRFDATQMWLRDASASPGDYESDFLSLLADAQAEHQLS